jgi:hypothetical protein
MRTSQHRFLRNVIASGSAASTVSIALLADRGTRETGSGAAPLNAISHWLHGDRAFAVDRANLTHTALGVAIHHASSLVWAALYEVVLRLMARPGSAGKARREPAGSVQLSSPAGLSATDLLAGAAVVTAVAALTDLRLVPDRLSPGFERRLSAPSVVLVYLGFAAGLALGAAASRRR